MYDIILAATDARTVADCSKEKDYSQISYDSHNSVMFSIIDSLHTARNMDPPLQKCL